jgi:hypothetical protein
MKDSDVFDLLRKKRETELAVLRYLLKVKPGMGEGYHWVTWNSCQTSWVVPFFGSESGR